MDRPIRLLAHGSAAICFGGSYEGPRLAKAAGLPLSGAGRDRRHRYQDGSDLPTALAPLWGLCGPEDRQWSATMRFALDPGQPGPDPGAVGRPRLSPHPRHLGCRLGRGLRWLEARADPYLQERG